MSQYTSASLELSLQRSACGESFARSPLTIPSSAMLRMMRHSGGEGARARDKETRQAQIISAARQVAESEGWPSVTVRQLSGCNAS